MELPYFNSITMTAIDPMHCLYEGTAKHMFRIWKDDGTIDDSKLGEIDKRIQAIDGSTQIGGVASRMSVRTKLNADEWKNWTLFYSLLVLKGILPDKKMKNWHTFVTACRILTRPAITRNQLKIVENLLLKFGREFSTLYGSTRVTPNMHFQCHITECIVNLGSVYTFWLFSFERFNGFLGKFKTNGKDTEKIIMRNMNLEQELYRIGHNVRKDLGANYGKCLDIFARTSDKMVKEAATDLYIMTKLPTDRCGELWDNLVGIDIVGKTKPIKLDEDDLHLLKGTYSVLYLNQTISVGDLCRFALEAENVNVVGEMFSAHRDGRRSRFSRIIASWYDPSGICLDNQSFRQGTIQRFLKHSITINGSIKQHLFAAVRWNVKYPYDLGYLLPIDVVYQERFEEPSFATFLPVQRIHSTYIAMTKIIGGSPVSVTIPIERKWLL